MKVFFVILILSISTSALSQQVPSRVGSTAQPPTAPRPAAMANGTGGSTRTPKPTTVLPSGLNETSADDIKTLLNAQTDMIKTLAVQIRRLAGQISQIERRVAKLESETE